MFCPCRSHIIFCVIVASTHHRHSLPLTGVIPPPTLLCKPSSNLGEGMGTEGPNLLSWVCGPAQSSPQFSLQVLWLLHWEAPGQPWKGKCPFPCLRVLVLGQGKSLGLLPIPQLFIAVPRGSPTNLWVAT